MNRIESLAKINEQKDWDIIIIGGGATGLGTALDAASRGYSTLLLEAVDFGKGTSGRSTKLVHGGVRYLEQGNIKLVKEALRERGWLLNNAAHITHRMAFIIPTFSVVQKLYYGAGLKMYDILSRKQSIGKTTLLNKEETLNSLPGLSQKKLTGGVVYYDGQFDDARLAIDLAYSASHYGATVINYFEVKELIKSSKKVTGVVAEDLITGVNYELNAKAVINATGVFADEIMNMDEPLQQEVIAPSQGIHLVVDKKFFPGDHAMMIPKTDDNRVLFAVPWHNKVVIGTTDTPVNEIAEEPVPLKEEVDFLLHHINRYLDTRITKKDVTSTFAGLRPLIKIKGVKHSALLSRDHTILVSTAGLVTVTGGKWTTYRKMAEDAVNNAAFVAKLANNDCLTAQLPIHSSLKKQIQYGNTLDELLELYSIENIRHYVQSEMAVTIEDILARRTRLLFLDANAAINMAPYVAKNLAEIFNKDGNWVNDQLADFIILAKQYLL